MRRGPLSAVCCLLFGAGVVACCLVDLVAFPGDVPRNTDSGPMFVLETVAGEQFRGPLVQLRDDWSIRLGPPSPRSRAAEAWLSVRRADLSLPPHPAEAQLLLTNGDRLPVAPASL